MSDWIKCSDRLPEKEDNYLVTDLDGDKPIVDFCHYHKRGWYYNYCEGKEYVLTITHWMPLPSAPSEEINE